jgi:hypothetical protein
MRILELDDVISLLRSEVERAGNQEAWARKAGVHRAYLNKVLNGHRPPNKATINALGLRMVFVARSKIATIKVAHYQNLGSGTVFQTVPLPRFKLRHHPC